MAMLMLINNSRHFKFEAVRLSLSKPVCTNKPAFDKLRLTAHSIKKILLLLAKGFNKFYRSD